jgi:hypothetical protein
LLGRIIGGVTLLNDLHMPLPKAPTQQPNKKLNVKANNELAIKGILCILIGLGVVVSPYFITSPGMQGIVARSAAVGWFALVLGLAFVGLYVRQHLRRRTAGKPL